MWIAVIAIISLATLGPSLLALALRLLLLALHTAGLLANLQIDPETRLTLRISRVEFLLWRHVGAFIWAPTRAALVTIAIPSIHVLVRKSPATSTRETRKAHPARHPLAVLFRDDDTDAKDLPRLESLDHPLWAPLRPWIYRLGRVCRFLHVVDLAVDDITVDVVEGESPVMSLQHGNATLCLAYENDTRSLRVHIQLAPTRLTSIVVSDAIVSVGTVAVVIDIPISVGPTDTRVPIPDQCSVVFESVSGRVDWERIILLGLRERSLSPATRRVGAATVPVPSPDRLLQILELLPGNVHLSVRESSLEVSGGASDKVTVRIEQLTICAEKQKPKQPGAHPKHQRKITASVGCVLAKTDTACRDGETTLESQQISVDINTSFSESSSDNSGRPILKSFTNFCGENKVLSLVVTKSIQSFIESAWATAQSHQSSVTFCQLEKRNYKGEVADDLTRIWFHLVEADVQVRLKSMQNEIVFTSRGDRCRVLPRGVPSLGVSIDEIVVYAHPQTSEDSLGVRAKSDIQTSRLTVWYSSTDCITRSSFLALDRIRVFVEPASHVTTATLPHAEVEMEAEWLEVRWHALAMHAIGGLLDLGIYILAPLLMECGDFESNEQWSHDAPQRVPGMRLFDDVIQDKINEQECIKFRCRINRALAIFRHDIGGERNIDYLTIDAIQMSVEETTGRFRFMMTDIRAYHTPANSRVGVVARLNQRQITRISRVEPKYSSGSRQSRRRQSMDADGTRWQSPFDKEYFSVGTFALEENRLALCPMSVVDLFVDGIRCEWETATQARVTELVRQVTYSAWEMLYKMRSTYGLHCTDSSSRYNRPGGLNAPWTNSAECDRCERLLPKLVSASGDKLHRLRATNIDFETKFQGTDQFYDVKLCVGLFGGDDLPNLWTFGDVIISCNEIELLRVDKLDVRHTVDKRRDYVFGEFEEILYLRQRALFRRVDGGVRRDGMLIDADGIRIGSALHLDLIAALDAARKSIVSHAPVLTAAFTSHWRPQEDVFFLYFYRKPFTPGQLNLWMDLKSTRIECTDRPMEAWLEHIYPVWMEELEEQELRTQTLNEQITALKLTNSDMLDGGALNGMKAMLEERNATSYAQRVKTVQSKLQYHGRGLHTGALLAITVGHINVDLNFEDDEAKTITSIRELDEATPVIDGVLAVIGLPPTRYSPVYTFRFHQYLDVLIEDVSVRLRAFPTPLVALDKIKVGGPVIVAATKAGGNSSPFDTTGSLRCYVDLTLSVLRPTAYFSPGYVHTMKEVTAVMRQLMPLLILDIDDVHCTAMWDIARRIFHGKVHVSIEDAAIRLLASPNTFEYADYLEASVQQVHVEYGASVVKLIVDRLAVRIDPDALVNIAELAHIEVQARFRWKTCSGIDSQMHYVHPVAYQLTNLEGMERDFILIDFLSHKCNQSPKSEITTCGGRLHAYQAADMSVIIDGHIALPASNNTGSKREQAARSAIILYTKHIEWLIRFASLYYRILRIHSQLGGKICVSANDRHSEGSASLLRVVKGVTIGEFNVAGFDLALYHSESSPIGVRVCISETINLSASIQQPDLDACGSNDDNPTRLPFCIGGESWHVYDTMVLVREVEVRVCSLQTGSRGESLVSVSILCLNIGALSEKWHHHLSGQERARPRFPIGPNGGAEPNPVRQKKTILEHFSISQENPYRFRDTDEENDPRHMTTDESARSTFSVLQRTFFDEFNQHGFVVGLAANEIRLLLTLDTIEVLVDIIEHWLSITRAMSGLSRLPVEIISPGPNFATENASPGVDLESPKKATSLTDDPRFGVIFRTGNPDYESRFMSKNKSNDGAMPDGFTDLSATTTSLDPFIMVRFMDCQVSILDHRNKGSVLLALSRGSLHDSATSDRKRELIDLNVDGVELFTAPMDVDVRSRIIWLKTLSDGTYCPGSRGLLQQVIAPIPVSVTVHVEREGVTTNKVDLRVPSIVCNLSMISKNMLQNLATAIGGVVSSKIAEYQIPDYTRILEGYKYNGQNGSFHSLQQLLSAKKQLQWEIAHHQWQRRCRWNYYANERAQLTLSATDPRHHSLSELDGWQILHRRQVSSASLSSSYVSLTSSTSTQFDATEDIQRLNQQLESISYALTSLVRAEQNRRQPNPRVEIDFALTTASLTLSANSSDILRTSMKNLLFKMKMYEDKSGSLALTISDVTCANLCPGTSYPELLIPLMNSKSWSGDDMFLRIDAEVASPVGGITIIQHFEVNVHPLQVCLTQDIILQLVAFFAPASPSTSTRQEEKKAEIRSQFLQAPQGGSTTDSLLKKAANFAGKATQPLSLGLGRSREDAAEDPAMNAKMKVMQSLQEEASLWVAKVAQPDNDPQLLTAEHEMDSGQVGGEGKDLHEMRDRAKSYILFRRIRLGTVEIVATYKHRKSSQHTPQQGLEDMRGFEIKIHSLVYCDKTCTLVDLLLRIRRDIILDVLSQVGRNFTNVANFLRDQFDICRWAPFDALAPLKSLSTTLSAAASTVGTSSSSVVSSTPGGSISVSTGTAAATTATTFATSTSRTDSATLTMDLLLSSPRVSSDASGTTATPVTITALPSPPTIPASTTSGTVDVAKVFQLELPESHPSLRKKHGGLPLPGIRLPEATAVLRGPHCPSPSSPRDTSDETHQPHPGKTKKMLSGLFGKSKKSAPAASAGHEDDARR